jgi:hypothetical protein
MINEGINQNLLVLHRAKGQNLKPTYSMREVKDKIYIFYITER